MALTLFLKQWTDIRGFRPVDPRTTLPRQPNCDTRGMSYNHSAYSFPSRILSFSAVFVGTEFSRMREATTTKDSKCVFHSSSLLPMLIQRFSRQVVHIVHIPLQTPHTVILPHDPFRVHDLGYSWRFATPTRIKDVSSTSTRPVTVTW